MSDTIERLSAYEHFAAPELPGLLKEVEVLAPFTYTTNLFNGEAPSSPLEQRLSALSTMAMQATILLAEQAPDAVIAIAGEHTFGNQYCSTPELMRKMAEDVGFDTDRIVLIEPKSGENLDNTPRQVAAHADYKLRLGLRYFQPTLAVAMPYHESRLLSNARALGWPIGSASAEDIIYEYRADLAGRFDEYYASFQLLRPFYRTEALINGISALELYKGHWLGKLTSHRGPRVDDIVDGKPMITTARKRVKSLGLDPDNLDI